MALPPKTISDTVMVRLGAVERINNEPAVRLEVSVALDKSADSWEVIDFVAREGDTLRLNGQRFTVNSIIVGTPADSEPPDTSQRSGVTLVSGSSSIELQA